MEVQVAEVSSRVISPRKFAATLLLVLANIPKLLSFVDVTLTSLGLACRAQSKGVTGLLPHRFCTEHFWLVFFRNDQT